MNSFVAGALIGITLALSNFYVSTRLSAKLLTVSKVTSVGLAVGEFIARLTILSLLFYGLSKIKTVHFQTALVAFLLCFTGCLILKTIRFLRNSVSFTHKQAQM
jgi:hypothetical protein